MKTKYLVIILLALVFTACQQANKEVSYKKFVKTGEAQGSYYSITYFDSLNRDFGVEIEKVLHDFDLSCSNYQPRSIISKVNRNEKVKLDSLFIGNFMMAQMVSEETQGDFDITVRPLVELWGFGLTNQQNVSKEQVDSIMQFVGYQNIRLDQGSIVKADPRIAIDYNAIAQGYSVDVMSKFLESKGVQRYLVDIGGEVYARRDKIDGSPWKIGIERPADSAQYGENLSAIIQLKNRGMATSGNYRKFYIRDGVKYAHTINPHTGYPVQHSLLSATVIAPNTGLADAYATAFMVMGIEKAKLVLARHQELDACFIYTNENGAYDLFITPGLDKMLVDSLIQP